MRSVQTKSLIGMLSALVLAIAAAANGEQPQDVSLADGGALSKTAAPPAIAATISSSAGTLEVQLLGNDNFEDEAKYGAPEVFVVPRETWKDTDGGKKVGEYRILGNPPLLVEGVKPGKYWVGVKTSFKLKGIGTLPFNYKLVWPHELYCWDGWEENPVVDLKEKMMYYSTWYPAWIENGRTALVVAIRMKDGDVNERLLKLRSRKPDYAVSNAISGHNAERIGAIIERYGKAFLTKDSVLSLTHVDGGLHHSMRGEIARKGHQALQQRLVAKIASMPTRAGKGSSSVSSVQPQTGSRQETAGSSNLLPPFKAPLDGGNEVRVVNPNDFTVHCGLRIGDRGTDFDVPPNGEHSAYVADGGVPGLFRVR